MYQIDTSWINIDNYSALLKDVLNDIRILLQTRIMIMLITIIFHLLQFLLMYKFMVLINGHAQIVAELATAHASGSQFLKSLKCSASDKKLRKGISFFHTNQ
ncbi:unnamed protein product [Orchesella dallaii]|uniref:Uncharacterized protein n=1 Tax=Orchesella dallaii TaxID=48710 RepID=A0ABP1QZ39_9HEXA